MNPYPDWLNPGDNAWQLVAATLVGLMSIPGIAVLYGGHRPEEVGRQHDAHGLHRVLAGAGGVGAVGLQDGLRRTDEARPGHPAGRRGQSAHASWAPTTRIRRSSHCSTARCRSSGSPRRTLAYFQFVFAAITPLLFLGSVIGRINFKVWLIFVPLWSTFAYSVNAFLVWGGGFWGQAHAGASSCSAPARWTTPAGT